MNKKIEVLEEMLEKAYEDEDYEQIQSLRRLLSEELTFEEGDFE